MWGTQQIKNNKIQMKGGTRHLEIVWKSEPGELSVCRRKGAINSIATTHTMIIVPLMCVCNFGVSLKWSFFSFVYLFPCVLKMISPPTFCECYKFCLNILKHIIQCISFNFPLFFLICCSCGPLLSCSNLAVLLFRPVTRLSSCTYPFLCIWFPAF